MLIVIYSPDPAAMTTVQLEELAPDAKVWRDDKGLIGASGLRVKWADEDVTIIRYEQSLEFSLQRLVEKWEQRCPREYDGGPCPAEVVERMHALRNMYSIESKPDFRRDSKAFRLVLDIVKHQVGLADTELGLYGDEGRLVYGRPNAPELLAMQFPGEARVPVGSRRGLQEKFFSHLDSSKAMIVHAPVADARRAIAALREANGWTWGFHLVQLREHDWTIVTSDGPLSGGLISDDGAAQLSRELATQVLWCLGEDTSGVEVGHAFSSGQPVLAIDNMNGISLADDGYEPPPPDALDDEAPEFDVPGHVHHYLASQGAYLPWIGIDASGPEPIASSPDHLDEDFARVEYLPYE